LQQTKGTDLWYAVTVVDKEINEKNVPKRPRSYSDPQILYSDTGSQILSKSQTQMLPKSQDVLAEERLLQSLSLPNAHQLRKSNSNLSCRDVTPSPPLVDDNSQEVALQKRKSENELLQSPVQLDSKQLEELNISPSFTADHSPSTADLRLQKSDISQCPKTLPSDKQSEESTSAQSSLQGKTYNQALQSQKQLPNLSLLTKTALQSSPAFTTSPPANYVSSTEGLMSQNLDVKPPQSPLLPRTKQLKESVCLSGIQSSPLGKTYHQALKSQESGEKLQKSLLLASQSSPTFTDVSTLPPQPLADSTEASTPQNSKSDVKSLQSSLLPSTKQSKESTSLSRAQSPPKGRTDHQAFQLHESEEKLLKSPLLTEGELQMSPTPRDVITSPLQSLVDTVPLTEALMPDKPQSAKLLKGSLSLSEGLTSTQGKADYPMLSTQCKADYHPKMDSSQPKKGFPQTVPSNSIKAEGSGNIKDALIGKRSPDLPAMRSLDVNDSIPTCSKLHLSRSSRSLDNQSLVNSDEMTVCKKPVNQTTSDDDKNAGQLGTPSPSKSGKLHSAGQSSNMEELNKEVYSFVANALQPQNKTNNSQSSLSDIFKKHCWKFENLSKPQPCEMPHKEKEDTKFLPESSQHQNESEPQRKKPLLPPRPKGITK